MKKHIKSRLHPTSDLMKVSMISVFTNLILMPFFCPVLMKVILFQWKRIDVAQMIYTSLILLSTQLTRKLFGSRRKRLLVRIIALVLYLLPTKSMDVYSCPRFFQDEIPSSIFVPPKRLHLMLLELTSLLSTKHLSLPRQKQSTSL